ncbi:MAG: rhomboid family intramembrane serine protease [Planctomycetota bacterium]
MTLQSQGIPHVVQTSGAGARILVGAPDADRARAELAEYGKESEDWPPAPEPTPPRLTSGIPGAAVFAAVIVAIYPVGQRGAFGTDWWSRGRIDADAVMDGEWWRSITALTLHVDVQHLVSNLVFGVLFGVLSAQSLGTGVAWLGTVLAGVGGNLVECTLVDPSHRAVGASTAIFGTLGLMVASEWARRGRMHVSWVRRAAPLFGGAVLFGWLGGGDDSGRVDVLAHAMGFLVGAVIGVAVGRWDLPSKLSPVSQKGLSIVALAIIATGWAIALTR